MARVLLIDIAPEIVENLSDKSETALNKFSVGSFGYAHPDEQKYFAVTNSSLSQLHEAEIIIADVGKNGVEGNEKTSLPANRSPDDLYFLVPDKKTYFNPRPYSISQSKHDIYKIIENGGVLVVFASKPVIEKYLLREYDTYDYPRNSTCTNYDFLNKRITNSVKNKSGKLIRKSDEAEAIFNSSPNWLYEATFEVLPDEAVILAVNNEDKPIGFRQNYGEGAIIVLPRPEDFESVIKHLVNNYLVDRFPNLFPKTNRSNWLSANIYQTPEVLQLKEELLGMRLLYEQAIQNKENEINEKEQELRFLQSLLVSDGDELVSSVKKVLEFAGYEDVRDYDEEQSDGRNKEEDIQIWGKDGLMWIAEVKGISGKPKEKECQQVFKYVTRRNKIAGRHDIRGIFIVNHKKHLPAIERGEAFTEPQIQDAEYSEYGLTTTWDIFSAIHKVFEGNLEFEDVRHALDTQHGIIEYLPRSYEEIGEVVKFYKKPHAALIRLFNGKTLLTGQEVVFISGDSQINQIAESIEVENSSVDEVGSESEFGLKVKSPVKKGSRFFVVR